PEEPPPATQEVHVHRIRLAALGVALVATLFAAASASATNELGHAVYTLTNSAAGNVVLAFSRAEDGTLSPQGTHATGGNGTGSNLGSQGAVVLSDDGHQLYAVNAGSNTISAFRVRNDGLALEATAPSGGVRPTSIAVHGHALYVRNAGGAG